MYPYPVVLVGSSDGLNNLEVSLSECAAQLEGRYSDLRAARGRKSDQPAVFLIRLHDEEDLNQLKLLANAFPGQPLVALIEGECDTASLFRINRAGAAQLVAIPLQSGDLNAALDRVARQFGRVPPVGKVIAVCGVIGGCGATELALNLGFEAVTRWNKKCIIAEPAVPFGRMAVYLDVQHPRPTGEIYNTATPLDLNAIQSAMTPIVEGLRLLAAPAATFPYHPPTGDRIEAVIDGARQVAEVIVLDLPYSFDDDCFRLLAQSDEVILVSDASVPGLEALRLVRDAVVSRRGSGPVRLIVNKYSTVNSPGLERMKEALKAERIWTIAEDGQAFSAAANKGGSLRMHDPLSPALADIDLFLSDIIGARIIADPTDSHGRRRKG